MAVIRPAPDREYEVEVGWQNDRYSFSLSFSQRFCQRVRAVDLERGEIVGDDGRRQDVLGARHTFERATGKRAPAWLFRLPRAPRAFVLPRGRLHIDESHGGIAIDPPPHCVPIFACFDGPFLEAPVHSAPDAFEPLERWQPVRLRLSSSVSIAAGSLADARLVRDSLEAVAGKRAPQWLASRPGLSRDVIILASPPGKHFSTLPELAEFRDRLNGAAAATDAAGVSFSTRARLSAASILTERTRYVCVTSDDLACSAISTRHELYHLLESEMMMDDEVRIVDDWYARTVENAGPFARTYGFLRAEFLPTLGELIQGAGGEAGQRWIDEQHPEGARWLRSFGLA